jgi:hypothetical protein
MMDDRFFGLRAFGKFLCKLCYEGVWVEHGKWPSGYSRYFHKPNKTWTSMIFITEEEIKHKHEINSDRGKGKTPKISYYRENARYGSYYVYLEGNYRLKRSEEFYSYTTCRAWGIPQRDNHRSSIAKLFSEYAWMNKRKFKSSREQAIKRRNEREVEELNHRLRHRPLIRKATPNRETVNFFRSLVFGGNL